ncbi:MAG: Lrp/AsnC family transcriptional regulator [Parvularculaceae bacterium]|nr:Lrp/AsnC family transcriptional regulator [Parvularculaceae bacterium]
MIDAIDRKILIELQKDCRQSLVEISEKVMASKSACHRRIKLMEDAGIIVGYEARLDPVALGLPMQFVVEVTLNTQSKEAMEGFERSVQAMPEINECSLTTGTKDYFLKVTVASVAAFEVFHHRLAAMKVVATVSSTLLLRTVKGAGILNL